MPSLIQIDGYDPVAGGAVTLRASSVDDDLVCHLDGQTWWPAIGQLPSLRYELFEGGFSGRIATPSSTFSLAVEAWPFFARYSLADARVRIWTGDSGAAFAAWTLRFDGRVLSQPVIAEGTARLNIAVDDRWLDVPLLSTYAGTGGAEGEPALKGQPKPLALGAPRYAPGRLIDSVKSIVQLNAYGPIEDVEAAMERLALFGPAAGDYASHAALAAATIPAGSWATSKAAGMVRHGARPVGRLSYKVKGDKASAEGWVRLPGSIIRRLAALAGGAAKVDDSSLTALNGSRPWNVSAYQGEQVTARDLIQRIAASVNSVAGVSWLGKLFVLPVQLGAAAMTLDATGAALPPVASVEQLAFDAPWWRLSIGAERTWEVHPLGDIAFNAVLVDRGDYVAGESYREGHIVLQQGSTWLYINPAPTFGNAPPALPATSNSWWRVLASKGADGSSGANGLAALLTNESHQVPTDTNGVVTSYAGATSAFRIFSGTTDVSNQFTLSTSANPQGLAVTYDNAASPRTFTVSSGLDAGEDNATLTVLATGNGSFAGVTVPKVFSLSKAKAGAAGAAGVEGANAWTPAFSATLTRAGTIYTKNGPGASAGFNSSLRSIEGYANAFVSWRWGQTASETAVGLNSDPATDEANTSIDYSIQQNSNGLVYLALNGANQRSLGGTTLTDVWAIAKRGGSIVAIKNGVVVDVFTTTASETTPFHLDSSFSTLGHSVNSIVFLNEGAGARTMTLSSTHQTFKYDASGAPMAQTTTFTATRQNTTAATVWTVRKLDGTQMYQGTAANLAALAFFGSTGPDNLSITHTNFNTLLINNATGGLIFEAHFVDGNTYVDKVSVLKLADGAAGAHGLSNAVVTLYQRAASAPAAPAGTFTYTFATGVLSGGTPGSWTQAVPTAGTTPLWSISATAAASGATDTIAAGEFSGPALREGAGLSTASVILYQRTATAVAPAKPSVTSTYTFASALLSGHNNGWTQAPPAASGGKYLWWISATAANTSATDEIAASEWATQQIMAEDGAPGAAGPAIVITPDKGGFTYVAGVLTPTPQSVTFTAALQGITGTINWTTLPNIKTGTGSSFSISSAELGANAQVVVTATVGAVSQSETFAKIADPSADNTAQSQILISIQEQVEVAADYTGSAAGLPKTLTPSVTRGGIDKRTDAGTSYALQNVSANLTGLSVNNTPGSADKGRVSLSSLTGSGSAQLVITVAGIAQPALTIIVTRTTGTAPSGGGAGGTGTKGGNANLDGGSMASASFVELFKLTGLVKASGETIRTYGSFEYEVVTFTTMSRAGLLKWQYSPTGLGSWTDMGAAVFGSNASYDAATFSADRGSAICNQSAAPSDGTYDVRLVAAMSNRTGTETLALYSCPVSVAVGT